MLGFISDNNIMHLKDFADYCMSDRAPAGWFELLTEEYSFYKRVHKIELAKENQVYKSEELNKKYAPAEKPRGYFCVFKLDYMSQLFVFVSANCTIRVR